MISVTWPRKTIRWYIDFKPTVLRIGIRYPVTFWPLDTGWEKIRIRNPRSGINIPDHISWLCNQGCGSVFIFYGSGSGVRIQYGSRALMTKNWKKITTENFFLFFFWSKTAVYLSLGLHKLYPSYRRSLQFSKEAIQHFKTWTVTNYCLLLWVIFALLDPDPDSEYGSGSGSTDPIEYGSNTDPDPQPCL